MNFNTINLAVRFLLEITALISLGVWGWNQSEGWPKYILVIGVPLIFAAIWCTFAVPNDPSRSGNAPVVIPGILRLILELLFFAFAVYCLNNLGYVKLSLIFGIITILHYFVSYERVLWLISLRDKL